MYIYSNQPTCNMGSFDEWSALNGYSSGFVMAITEFKISGVKGTASFLAGANSAITGLDVKGDRDVVVVPSTSVGLLIFSLNIYIFFHSFPGQQKNTIESAMENKFVFRAHTHNNTKIRRFIDIQLLNKFISDIQ